MCNKFINYFEDPKMTATAATFVLAIMSWIIRWFTRFPRKYAQARNSRRNQRSVVEGAHRDAVLSRLKRTGAIYIHLIRYHNGGGALKRGVPLKMSIDIEKTGTACKMCAQKCPLSGPVSAGVKPISVEWQNILLKGSWLSVVQKTVMTPSIVNQVKKADLDVQHREIWDHNNIFLFKEIFVKHKRECFYTIGLFFCQNYKKQNQTDGLMSLASRQLNNLL